MNGEQLSLFPKLWSHTEGQHSVTSHFVAQSESTVKPFLSISYPQCTPQATTETSVLHQPIMEIRPMADEGMG